MGPVTGTKKTELHVLSRNSDFKEFIEHTGTALHYTDPQTRPWAWDFGIGSGNGLICIARGPLTGSGKTEVHTLTCDSKYSQFNMHAVTRLHLTCTKVRAKEPEILHPSEDWLSGLDTSIWDFCVASNDDIVCIKKGPPTGSQNVEVHRLSAAQQYQGWNLQTATGLDFQHDKDVTFALTN